jgi:hypothetical protein
MTPTGCDGLRRSERGEVLHATVPFALTATNPPALGLSETPAPRKIRAVEPDPRTAGVE